jgi:hypothetical protein
LPYFDTTNTGEEITFSLISLTEVCGDEILEKNSAYANGIKIFREESNPGTWISQSLSTVWNVKKINGDTSTCKIKSYTL